MHIRQPELLAGLIVGVSLAYAVVFTPLTIAVGAEAVAILLLLDRIEIKRRKENGIVLGNILSREQKKHGVVWAGRN